MIINFKNNCNSNIYIDVDNVWNGIINSNDHIQITCNTVSDVAFSVCICNESVVKSGIYNLNLMSKYIFEKVEDNAEFVITRERIRVSIYVSYERLFVDPIKAQKTTEETFVKNAESIKKRYKRDRFVELLYGPLTHFPTLSIILFVGGIMSVWLTNWCLTLLYYLLVYSGLFGLHCFVDVFWKKVFRTNAITDFYQYFDPAYISYYYSQTKREPFMGKIDRK